VIPLLPQAALEAACHSRNFAGNPIPVAIVGANHISGSVSEEAKEFVRKRAPEVGLKEIFGHGAFFNVSVTPKVENNSEANIANYRAYP
jgi:hypothetical protein